jgi:catechol-2,3-dioxygenase
VHIFFALADGSMVAFFDLLDGRTAQADPHTPSWVNHLALRVSDVGALGDAKARLEREGVDVMGIIDHGWFHSIYFFDPNGIRLELVSTSATQAELDEKARTAHETLREVIAARTSPAP